MSARLRETKAMNAKNAEILRGLLKLPDNKYCVDCKHNDARWASTNLGIFLCIRCSGIHRGLGVHISRVRSVDLDTWSPEQIANMQRWGNAKANLYWEAHLKEGHQPPEHKIEQFIRSKYESKRWAMEGPVPDPDTLGAPSASTAPEQVASPTTASVASPKAKAPSTTRPSAIDLLGGAFGDAPSVSAPSSNKASPSLAYPSPPSGRTSSLPSSAGLNGPSRVQTQSAAPPKAASPPPPAQSGNGLFDLDFSGSSTNNNSAPRKNANDIMSLFGSPSAAPSAPVHSHNNSGGGGLDAFASLNLGGQSGWGAPATSNVSYGGNASQYQQAQSTHAQPGHRPASNSISNPWAAAPAVDSGSAKTSQSSNNFYSPPQANNTSKPPAYGMSNDFFSAPATANTYSSAPKPASSQPTTNTQNNNMDFFNSQDIWGAPISSSNSSKPAGGDAFGGFSSGTTGKNTGGFDDLWN